ncbi:MAG: type IV pilus twitching motility protein PilT [Candidatus Brocadiae bacterium]|nr:type IV pilus twitching motility protein PilT [Candidatus Brocadiia bacterium]
MPQIDILLQQMLEAQASDLHLSSDTPVMMRIHGKMKKMGEQSYSSEYLERLLQEIVPERNAKEFTSCHDTDFAYTMSDTARFRINIFLDNRGIGAVCRMIPSKVLTTDELGIPEAVTNLCYLTKGLVLVTGPTGSGKSTTLASMIDLINRTREGHIITIEDPIEFLHQNQNCLINQREVKVHTQNFKKALRAALREDPDVILVGELRDLETVEIALETAETGHLVFGTLHTTTAASSVDRLIDQFPANQQAQIRTMLAESLKGVISQVLLRKIDGSGRVLAMEILLVNHAIAANIREGKTHQINMAISTGKRQGMTALQESLMELVIKKTVDPFEAYTKAVDKEGFLRETERLGIPVNLYQMNPKLKRTQQAPYLPMGTRMEMPKSMVSNVRIESQKKNP